MLGWASAKMGGGARSAGPGRTGRNETQIKDWAQVLLDRTGQSCQTAFGCGAGCLSSVLGPRGLGGCSVGLVGLLEGLVTLSSQTCPALALASAGRRTPERAWEIGVSVKAYQR